MVSISENIRVERARRRWTASDLAQRAGVSMTTIYAIEGDRVTPSLSTVADIAAAFGVTVTSLIEASAPVVQPPSAQTAAGHLESSDAPTTSHPSVDESSAARERGDSAASA